MPTPTPSEIIEMATRKGYQQRRPEASSTLFFQKTNPDDPPILVNIYYTTRSVMTFLTHPTAGSNQLWRSNAYQDLDELENILENPRVHTEKGYRNKHKAVRGCAGCGDFKERREFSENQWHKGPDANKCRDCVSHNYTSRHVKTEEKEDLVHVKTEEEDPVVPLTAQVLEQHDKLVGSSTNHVLKKERRQFNCPDCPKHGRGKFIFFKKVPVYKPVVKCPKCKRVTHGNCRRLHPIPKGKEKGYGLFKCHICNSTWGSSRAVANIGQQCYSCRDAAASEKEEDDIVWVRPFRLEVVKYKKSNSWGGILGGGPRKAKRTPNFPMREDEPVLAEYTSHDEERHASAAANALAGLENDLMGLEIKQEEDATIPLRVEDNIVASPSGYSHHCQGCATGICRSRFLPKSVVHDSSDGDTVSTSASAITNSSVAKDEYLDRDLGFDDFDDDESTSSWQHVNV